MQKRNLSRFWIALFLDDLQENDIFQPGLLHITLLPWFVADMPDMQIISAFRAKFSDFTPLKLTIDNTTFFGPDKDVPVALIRPTEDIENLHMLCLDWYSEIKGRWAVKNPYIAEDFRPHIRIRSGYHPEDGENLLIKSVYLIKAARAEDGQRTVAAKAGA